MEPWNIKKDDSRSSDSLPTFIIFCEDKVSEPIYFKYFETNLIKVNAIGEQKSKDKNVIRTINHCVKEGLMNEVDGTCNFNEDEIQVWCVFDRDKEGIPDVELLGNTEFNTAIRLAVNSGLKVAWSNDAFELWILLHFEDVDQTVPESKNRAYYYQRLTEIFLALPNPNQDLINVRARADFDYKKHMKHENNFRNIVRSEIVSKTLDAIRRAKTLEENHNGNPALPFHEKAPCTTVYNLVEELIRLGKKM